MRLRLAADDAYFQSLSRDWARMLNEARETIPDPPFMRAASALHRPNATPILPTVEPRTVDPATPALK